MLIMMNLNAPREDVEKVKGKIISKNCTPHEIPGSSKLAIGITGLSRDLNESDFLLMDSVEDVVRVTKQYKLVSREMKPDDTIIRIGEEKIGGDELTVIAGP
jgi:3-deoxy-7-phosphoheptulonate synthase